MALLPSGSKGTRGEGSRFLDSQSKPKLCSCGGCRQALGKYRNRRFQAHFKQFIQLKRFEKDVCVWGVEGLLAGLIQISHTEGVKILVQTLRTR